MTSNVWLLGSLVRFAAEVASELGLDGDGYRVVTNTGKNAGQSAVAYRASPRLRMGILGAASGGLLTAGVVGIFSIGLPLLIAGVLSCVAWAVVATHPVPSGAVILSLSAAVGAGALLVLGIALT